jgi:hypothetical protein
LPPTQGIKLFKGRHPIQRERKLTSIHIVRQSTGQATLRKCNLLDAAAELPDGALQLLGSGGVIIAALKTANGNAATTQGVDFPAQLRATHLKIALQLPAGDGICLTLVVKRKIFRKGFADCHSSSFPEPLSRNRRQKERKKEGAAFPHPEKRPLVYFLPAGLAGQNHVSYCIFISKRSCTGVCIG